MINLQAIFDKVVQHLMQQKAKAMLGESCRYLTDNGLRCAVGCLIDAAHYNPGFEGNCPDWIKSEYALNPDAAYDIFNAVVASQQITFTDESEKPKLNHLLKRLQSVHDNWDVSEWPMRLECLAKDLNLQYAP
jgi:hypothetical protein